MRFFLTCLFVALTTMLAGCFSSEPSEAEAKAAVVDTLTKPFRGNLAGSEPKIIAFKKTDGSASEHKYGYFFEADIVFNRNVSFANDGWGFTHTRVNTNQKVHMTGVVILEKRESGWAPVDYDKIQFKVFPR